jgi:uncharacterized protein involved in exopolysaccharide biosynthesis
MPVNPSPPPVWTDAVKAVGRHKIKAFSFFLGAVVVAGAYLVLAPKAYRSEGKLLVKLGRENATLDPTVTPGHDPVVTVPVSREEEINSVVEVLRNRALLEKVVDSLGSEVILAKTASASDSLVTENGLTGWFQQAKGRIGQRVATAADWVDASLNGNELTERDEAIEKLSRSLRVQAASRSNVIAVSYRAKSPKAAQAVVASLTDHFLDEHVRIHRTPGSHAFFAEQVGKLRAELDRNEKELCELKLTTGLASPDEQRKLHVERIAALEAELMRAEADRAVTATKVDLYRQKRSGLQPTEVASTTTGVGHEATDEMRALLYSLEMQEKAHSAKYTDLHPRLIEIRGQLADAREVYRSQDTTRTHTMTAPSKLFQETEMTLLTQEPHLAALQSQTTTLQRQLATAREDLNTFNANELRYVQLQRDVLLNEETYRKYVANLEESRIDQAREGQRMSNISIVQAASLDGKPVWPIAGLVMALGVLTGLFGGVGLALLADRLNRSFHEPEELEKSLALPTLASIPRFDREQLTARRN